MLWQSAEGCGLTLDYNWFVGLVSEPGVGSRCFLALDLQSLDLQVSQNDGRKASR